MKGRLDRIAVALRDPFASSAGTARHRELLILSLEDGEGHTGYGESAPLRATADVVEAALRRCLRVLAPLGSEDRELALGACRRAGALPEALAAVDLALWDLAGRRAREPVWRLLGAQATHCCLVNATIAAPDRAGAARQAAAAREAGFSAVKVKVGLGDDAVRVAAVRAAAGSGMTIRLDANGAWDPPEARAALGALAPAGIELCEEPVSGLAQVRALSAGSEIPVAIDETALEPGALDRRACHAVCLKVCGWGGIDGLLRAWQAARRAGYAVYLASSLDGPLGIAAALHAAAVIAPEMACGLATLRLFEGADPLPPVRGKLAAPSAPGLGVDPPSLR